MSTASRQFGHCKRHARVQAGLGIAAEGEEESINGGEIAKRIEYGKGEQGAARDVDIYSKVSSNFRRARTAFLAQGGH